MPAVPSLTRRSALQLLGLAAVAATAGCRSSKQAAPAAPASGATPATASAHATADATPARPTTTASASPPAATPTMNPIVQGAASSEQALIAAYDDALRANPQLAGALGVIRSDHVAHLKALDPGVVVSPAPVPTSASISSAPSPASASSAPASSTPSNPSAPASPAPSTTSGALVASLTDLETRAATARLDDMANATGSLAAVLASIGGCEAAHAATLATTLGSP